MSRLILIIEDDEDIASNLQELLEGEGYGIQIASHGADALEWLGETTTLPGLILLDLMMPKMDGWTFRERQLSNQRISSIPVIVMTADGQVEGEKIQGKPVEAFLRKPVDIDNLLEVVHRLC